ncbi:MAG: hydrogenase [Candidatus Eremiobacteraeota bacterium]|jgi:hydrogenase-4 component E|nr:hydrogenase [Candidatus Eremiobacteraeota bacterium]MCL5054487.1 hydrogenase [Bacillota bacterium]
MIQDANFILLIVIVLDLYIVSSSRLDTCVNATALQGAALAFLPFALWWKQASSGEMIGLLLIGAGTFVVKSLLIPFLIFRSIREANVRREVEPSISLHFSLFTAAVFVAGSFWMASIVVFPQSPPASLIVPAAFVGVLVGFLLLVSRQKAITQVVGYLILENGIFIFGQILFKELPFIVELGILLDLLVGVLVMGIAINHISRQFDHIDVNRLDELKG